MTVKFLSSKVTFTLAPSLKSKSKNLASLGSLVTVPSEVPIVILGKRPLILLNRSCAITSSFIIQIFI